MKRRILVLMTVVALMMVIMAMTIAPAFASPNPNLQANHACPAGKSHPQGVVNHYPPACT
jgi:hypothetical protein